MKRSFGIIAAHRWGWGRVLSGSPINTPICHLFICHPVCMLSFIYVILILCYSFTMLFITYINYYVNPFYFYLPLSHTRVKKKTAKRPPSQ